MVNFYWEEEFTQLAIRNLKHKPWAVLNPYDMLKAVQIISKNPNGFPISNKEELIQQIGTKHSDFMNRLGEFGFVLEENNDQGEWVYVLSKSPQQHGFLTGEHVSCFVREDGLSSTDALHAIGHNFILGARESLEFCSALTRPGLDRKALESRFLNKLVFNNKLNEHKFHNLLQNLTKFNIIAEGESGYEIVYSPAPLTFYCITQRYLLDANYKVGEKVHAADLLRHLDRILPVGRNRSESFDTLGFPKFPFEGWGKYRTWLTKPGFEELLRVGLIHPLSVARVLANILLNSDSMGADIAVNAFIQLKKTLLDECQSSKLKSPPIGLEDVLKEYDYARS